ncbi:3-hydroxyacyl-CoA dehydrogenase family protein [Dietzia timorensis]|uniref:Putative 3-hydroxyacyl-CoA dehydrogenase F54C8.1 n=1 Tax=Dietzia timorensis TaxID=499555 RepID=A0A173LLM7_9ACTN|nr:3-hydroxyacyl-CoA dehydrogenase family protein [Dietzia timorensis]ANI91490.1 putative 3-hydroxyacyl-CoA dehydrogenase F54C8.1 [Dietzia timorensis]
MSDQRSIDSVLVVGAGAMGSQIAMVCALSGYDVVLNDISGEALDRAVASLRSRMQRKIDKGTASPAEIDSAFARLRTTDVLEEESCEVDLVIEAAIEKLDVKRELFATLERLAPADAILASNSSSFVPSAIAARLDARDRFCNIHFFNPALVMRCVEVIRGPETSDDTMAAAIDFVRRIGKEPVQLDKEITGFVANRILDAVRTEAVALYEGGYASFEDIDLACRTALGYPMGPFELMDLTGIDIGYYSRSQRFADSGDPADAPARSVAALVERGDLGRKTGRGWYVYDESGTKAGPNPDA